MSASPNWCQWCDQSGIPIRSKWICQIFSPILPSPNLPPPLIWCRPGGWGVCRINSYRGRISERGRGARHAICCDMQWWSLRCCISVCDVQRRMWHSCKFVFKVRGGYIMTCTQKSKKSLAANTGPFLLVPNTFIQAPVFLKRMMRQWSVPSRSSTISLSLVWLTSSGIFFHHNFLSWDPEGDWCWKNRLPPSWQ